MIISCTTRVSWHRLCLRLGKGEKQQMRLTIAQNDEMKIEHILPERIVLSEGARNAELALRI